MMLDKAIELLEAVVKEEKWIPYKRHYKSRAHHPGMRKWMAGGHPVKASTHIIKILKNAEANADNKGLDIDRLKVVHAATHRGRIYKKFTERAFGRSSPFYEESSHIEIVLEEVT